MQSWTRAPRLLIRSRGEREGSGWGRGRLSHSVHAAEAWCTLSSAMVVVLIVQGIVRPAYTLYTSYVYPLPADPQLLV